MKQVCRDFILVIGVPDDVKPEDCEIVIDKASASYKQGDTNISMDEGDVEIVAEDPYEH